MKNKQKKKLRRKEKDTQFLLFLGRIEMIEKHWLFSYSQPCGLWKKKLLQKNPLKLF